MTIVFPITSSSGGPVVPAPVFDERFPKRDEIPLAEGVRHLYATVAQSGSTLRGVDLIRVQVLIPDATFAASDW